MGNKATEIGGAWNVGGFEVNVNLHLMSCVMGRCWSVLSKNVRSSEIVFCKDQSLFCEEGIYRGQEGRKEIT